MNHHLRILIYSVSIMFLIAGCAREAAVAERGEMKLFLADCALEAGRLYNGRGDKEKARAELEKAKGLVEETGYHRRDKDVEKLQEELR